MDRYYPIMLDIYGKSCVVIGGGKVAERKVLSLLDYGAKITVISPDATEPLKKLKIEDRIHRIERDYQYGDIKGHFLAYVATNNKEINANCLKEAREQKVLINIVDKPGMCDFIVPASVKRGDLSITVSTNGKSPMLSGKIRKDLEEFFGEEYGEYVNALGELRNKVLAEINDITLRKKIFEEVVYSDLLIRYKNEEFKDMKKVVMKLYDHVVEELQIGKGEEI